MNVAFNCPTCGKSFQVDAANAGRTGRCNQCGGLMTVPVEASDAYSLIEPESAPPRLPSRVAAAVDPEDDFDERADPAPRRTGKKKSRRTKLVRQAREEASDLAAILAATWRWLVGVPLAVVAVFWLIAALVPNGTLIVASILAAAGMILILAGFGIGARGAFHEDFLNGMLYVCIPFYTAYFIVTNWDTMWRWFLLMAGGSVLILIAGEIALPRLEEMTKARAAQSLRIVPGDPTRPVPAAIVLDSPIFDNAGC